MTRGRGPAVALLLGGLATLAALPFACGNGAIRASGSVVDAQTGEPLRDVRMQERRARLHLLARDFAATTRSESRVDGRFAAHCVPCRVLALRFVKEGYHEARLELGLGDDARRFLARTDLRVALQPVLDPAELERSAGILEVGAVGDTVLPVGREGTTRPVPEATLESRRASGEGAPHVRLLVEREPDGTPRVASPEQPGGTRAFPMPVAPVLDFSSAGGGAQWYRPRARNVQEIELEMREAPEDGYLPVLPLDAEADTTRYFFFRANGRYGRGSVQPVGIERTSSGLRAVVGVELLSNPDGSRNLEPTP